MVMKKRLIIIMIIVLILATLLCFLPQTIKISNMDIKLLQVYSDDEKSSVIVSYPEKESEEIAIDKLTDILLTANNGVGFFGVAKENNRNVVFSTDENLNVTNKFYTNIIFTKLYTDTSSAYGLSKDSNEKFSVYKLNFDDETCDFICDLDLTYDNIYLAICNDKVVYENNDEKICVYDIANNTNKTCVSDKVFVSKLNNEAVVLFKPIISLQNSKIGVLYKYIVDTDETVFLRVIKLNSRNATISPDGEYLLSYKIVPWEGICKPTVYSLKSYSQKNYDTCGELFDNVEWIK